MSLFSGRQYVWLASAMRDLVHEAQSCAFAEETQAIIGVVYDLADALASESSAFHRELFLHNALCDPLDHQFGDSCPHAHAPEPVS